MNPQMSPEQTNEVPHVPEQVSKIERERKEALDMVLALVKEKKTEIGVLVAYGKEYPVREGNIADIMVARAQSLHNSAKEVLENVRGVDYRKEEAAAKLEGLFSAYEELASRLAELYENNPDIAEKTKELMKGVFVQEEINLDDKYRAAP